VDRFDEATDEFWNRVSGHYRFAAVRTAAALNLLYPPDDPRYRRILVNVNSRTAGWVVLLAQPLSENKYFGNMRAGVIADYMAAPADMLPVMVGAGRELDKMGLDISLANTLHPAAIDALRRAGYLSGPTNYGFGLSKPLAALMTPIDQSMRQVHLTRGDGDGLANFSVRPAGRNDAE